MQTNRQKTQTQLKSIFFISLMLSLGISFTTFGQAPESHKKSTYVDSLNNFYVQQTLPIYLNISTQPDGKGDVHTMKNTLPPKFKNPITFDAHGRYNLDLKRNSTKASKEGQFVVYADGVAPKSRITYSGAVKYVKSGNIFYGKGLNATMRSSDAMSGLKGLYFSLNSNPYTSYRSAIDLNREGEFQLNFYGADNVGNVETVNENTFTVDQTSPQSQHELGISGKRTGTILSSAVKIKLSSGDQLSGVASTKYTIDGGTTKSYFTAPVSIATLADGDHTLTYYSTDRVKNQEAGKTYSFYLDKIAPSVAFTLQGEQFKGSKQYVSPSIKIKFTAIDNKSGVENIVYSVNSGTEMVYSEPISLPNNKGSVAIRYYATDKVGNTSSSSKKTLALFFDAKTPTISSSFLGREFTTRDTVFISEITKVRLKADDYASGIKSLTYSLDGAAAVNYNQPLEIKATGFHSVKYIATDNVANVSEKEVTFFVDNIAPDLKHFKSAPEMGQKTIGEEVFTVIPKHCSIFLIAVDKHTGTDQIYYTINGSKELKYTTALANFKVGQTYRITYRATDKLGNFATETMKFYIEK